MGYDTSFLTYHFLFNFVVIVNYTCLWDALNARRLLHFKHTDLFFSVDQINEPIHSQSFFILSYLYTTMYAGKESDLFHIIQFIEM